MLTAAYADQVKVAQGLIGSSVTFSHSAETYYHHTENVFFHSLLSTQE